MSLGNPERTQISSYDNFDGQVPNQPSYVLGGNDAELFSVETKLGEKGQPQAIVSVALKATLQADQTYYLKLYYHDGQEWTDRQLITLAPVKESFLADQYAARKERAKQESPPVLASEVTASEKTSGSGTSSDSKKLPAEVSKGKEAAKISRTKEWARADELLAKGDHRGSLANLAGSAKGLFQKAAASTDDDTRVDFYNRLADTIEKTIADVGPYREVIFERGKSSGKVLENLGLMLGDSIQDDLGHEQVAVANAANRLHRLLEAHAPTSALGQTVFGNQEVAVVTTKIKGVGTSWEAYHDSNQLDVHEHLQIKIAERATVSVFRFASSTEFEAATADPAETPEKENKDKAESSDSQPDGEAIKEITEETIQETTHEDAATTKSTDINKTLDPEGVLYFTQEYSFTSSRIAHAGSDDVELIHFKRKDNDLTQFEIKYSVAGSPSSVDIEIYRSDSATPVHTVAGSTEAETHTQFIDVADEDILGLEDASNNKVDYYLYAKVVTDEGFVDSLPSNNTKSFAGGVYLLNSILYLQAPNSWTVDDIDIQKIGTDYKVTWNTVGSMIPIDDVNEIHMRTHGGNDDVRFVSSSLNLPVWFFGGSGNDNLRGGAGADYFDGGSGRDNIFGYNGNDEMHGGDAYGYGGDYLYGQNDDDTIYGNAAADMIYGGSGNDLIYGGDEDPTYYGSDPNGPAPWTPDGYGGGGYFDGWGGDWIDGGSGNDTIHGGEGHDFITGYSGDDTLYGGEGDDYLIGGLPWTSSGSGNDTLYGGEGDDSIEGGDGDDNLYGDAGNDKIYGDSGNDILDGGAGNDKLYGSAGNDFLTGGTGNDTLYGEAGDDTLWNTGGGVDFLSGGTENDQYYLSNQNATVTLDDTGGTDTINLSTDWAGPDGATLDLSLEATPNPRSGLDYAPQLIYTDPATAVTLKLGLNANIENAVGTPYSDLILGNDLNNTLTGGAGDDILDGGVGNDTYVFSGEVDLGTDTLIEAAGNGSDTLDFMNLLFGAGVNVDLRNNTGVQQYINEDGRVAAVDWVHSPEIENVTGTYFEDILRGNAASNDLDGIFADDEIYGYGGDDTLRGGFGADLLAGGAGDDLLYGSYGDDTYRFIDPLDMGKDSVFEEAGEGTDTLDFSGLDVPIDIDLTNAGVAEEVAVGRLMLEPLGGVEIENIVGTAQADEITGNEFNNVLEGGDGDDSLYGGDGDDVINGGEGADYGEGGEGNDTSDFGSGDTAPPEIVDIPLIRARKELGFLKRIEVSEISSADSPFSSFSETLELFGIDGVSFPEPGFFLIGDILKINALTVQPGDYSVQVKATSTNGLTDSQIIDVKIEDYNENSPTVYRLNYDSDDSVLLDGAEYWFDSLPPERSRGSFFRATHVDAGINLFSIPGPWYSNINIRYGIYGDGQTPTEDLSFTVIDGPGSVSSDGVYTQNTQNTANTSSRVEILVSDDGSQDDTSVRSTSFVFYVSVSHVYDCNGDNSSCWSPREKRKPIATDKSYGVEIDGTVANKSLSHPDIVISDAQYSITSGPQHGTISDFEPATGQYSYTPSTGFQGIDTFWFKVKDNLLAGTSNRARVTIRVGPTVTGDIDTLINDDEEAIAPGQRLDISPGGQSDLFEVKLSTWLREDQHASDYKVSLLINDTAGNPAIRIWESPDKKNEIFHRLGSISNINATQWRFDEVPKSVFVEPIKEGQFSLSLMINDYPHDKVLFSSNSLTIDLDIDSDNNGTIDGSAWEEELEDHEYGLGKLVMQNYGTDDPGENAQGFTPITLRLPAGLDPDDPALRIRIDYNSTGTAGFINLWKEDKALVDPLVTASGSPQPGTPNAANGGLIVTPNAAYKLSDLGYCPQCGSINLFISAWHENLGFKTLNGVGEQTLIGSENNGKPEEFITATLVVNGDDVSSDKVKYIVTQPDSFFSHLQDRPEVRTGLAASGVYTAVDLPQFGLRLLSDEDLVDLGVTSDDIRNNLTGNPTAAGLDAVVYQDYITGGDNQYVLAFGGTEIFSADDWAANFAQGLVVFDNEGVQYLKAMKIAVELANAEFVPKGNLIATGHSLGGGLASAASVVADIPAYTFNAAGLNQNTLEENGVERVQGSVLRFQQESGTNNAIKQIQAYYVDWDILSFAQDFLPLVRSAIGHRSASHKMDGPYDPIIDGEIINPFDFDIQEFATDVLTDTLFMLSSHPRPAYLYGLLSETNTATGDDIFGYEL